MNWIVFYSLFFFPSTGIYGTAFYKDIENLKDRIFTLCKSYVVLPDGSNDQLKDFEVPHEIHFLDELPRRAGTEKINYQILEQSAQ